MSLVKYFSFQAAALTNASLHLKTITAEIAESKDEFAKLASASSNFISARSAVKNSVAPKLNVIVRKACDSQTGGVRFVVHVDGDKQCRQMLQDACVLQLAAMNRAHSGDLACQFARDLKGPGIVAAHDHVAIHASISGEQVSGDVLKSCRHRHVLWHQLRRLLCSRALPYAQHLRSTPAHRCR